MIESRTTILNCIRGIVVLATAAGIVATQTNAASAVSLSVKYACMKDYFRYCSDHAVGSQALRHCMRANGERLSRNCINALVSAGEVSQAEVDRRAARMKTAGIR